MTTLEEALAEIERLKKRLDQEWGAGWDEAVRVMRAKNDGDEWADETVKRQP